MPLYRHPKSPYWWVRFTVGGVKVRRSSETTDREAADEFEARLRSDLWRQVRLGERPKYLWSQAVERWYAEAQGRDKKRDYERLKWFAEYLNSTPLVAINRRLIDKLREVKTAESSTSTSNRHMALLRMIMRKAERDWEWIDRAPVVPMYRQEKSEPRFLTHDEFARLLKNLPTHLAALAEFSVETGLRMRNVTGLTWHQVSLDRQQMFVPAAHAKAGETIALPLSRRALAILQLQQGKHPERVFIFRGKPIDDCNGASFKKATKLAGLSWLRWHDLRHTWASWHVQSGTPLHVLQELGGWRTLAMVQRYAHLSTDHLKAYAEHRSGIPKTKTKKRMAK